MPSTSTPAAASEYAGMRDPDAAYRRAAQSALQSRFPPARAAVLLPVVPFVEAVRWGRRGGRSRPAWRGGMCSTIPSKNLCEVAPPPWSNRTAPEGEGRLSFRRPGCRADTHHATRPLGGRRALTNFSLIAISLQATWATTSQIHLRRRCTPYQMTLVSIGVTARPAAGKDPVGVAVDQQRQHHPRVILRRPRTPMVHLEDAQIDALDRRDHEMRQIVLGYPVAKIGRKQKRLLAITVNEVAHPKILTKTHRKVRQTASLIYSCAVERCRHPAGANPGRFA